MVCDHHLFQIWLQKDFFFTCHILKTLRRRRRDFAQLKRRHEPIFEDPSFLNPHFRNFHYHTVVTTHLIAPPVTPDGNGRIVLMKWLQISECHKIYFTLTNQLACLSALLFLRSAQVCVCVSARQTERERWNQNRFQWRGNADEPAL